MGFIPEHEIEWGCLGRVMGGGVVLELSSREEVEPTFGVVGTEDVKVCFYLLISMLHLSVSLRVIGCGELNVILEESSKLPSKSGHELGSPVGYDRVV